MKPSGLDVVFINPGKRSESYQSLGSELAAIEPPVWAGLMTTFVRNHGLSAQILDANAEDLTYAQTARKALANDPSLVVVVVYGHNPSASTQNMPAAGKVCRAIKEQSPDTKVLLVGGHVAALAERTLQEEQADFTSDGEGPYTIIDLCATLRCSSSDFDKVRDLWFRDNGIVRRSHARASLISNVDESMSGIPWADLAMHLYRAHNWHCFGMSSRKPYAAIYTTLGCPFHCSFCCIQAPFRSGEQTSGIRQGVSSYRSWSVDRIVSELTMLSQTYGVVNVKFADELFVLKPSHVNGICQGIIERSLNLNIWAYARIDTLSHFDLNLLKKAGINWLALGIESANERVRDDCNKGYRGESVRETVKRIKDAGIYCIGNYIFGLPEDDLSSMQETLTLAKELNCEFANFYCAMAYPGSELYNEAVRKKWPLPTSWDGYSQLSKDTLPLPTRYLDGPQVLAFRDKAFMDYFTDSSYLNMIATTFGAQTRESILAMTAVPLVRTHCK